MEKCDLQSGEIVQLNPETVRTEAFAGCLMIVTKLKSWGVQGYIQGVGAIRAEMGEQIYYEAKWSEMELTGGHAVWVMQ